MEMWDLLDTGKSAPNLLNESLMIKAQKGKQGNIMLTLTRMNIRCSKNNFSKGFIQVCFINAFAVPL
jgi:hypothetical protein